MWFVREKGLHYHCKSFTCRKTLSDPFHSCFVLNTYPLMLYLSRHVYLTQRNNCCIRGLRSTFLAFIGILVFPSVCDFHSHFRFLCVVFFTPKFRKDCLMCCMPFYPWLIFLLPLTLSEPSYLKTMNLLCLYSINRDGVLIILSNCSVCFQLCIWMFVIRMYVPVCLFLIPNYTLHKPKPNVKWSTFICRHVSTAC